MTDEEQPPAAHCAHHIDRDVQLFLDVTREPITLRDYARLALKGGIVYLYTTSAKIFCLVKLWSWFAVSAGAPALSWKVFAALFLARYVWTQDVLLTEEQRQLGERDPRFVEAMMGPKYFLLLLLVAWPALLVGLAISHL